MNTKAEFRLVCAVCERPLDVHLMRTFGDVRVIPCCKCREDALLEGANREAEDRDRTKNGE